MSTEIKDSERPETAVLGIIGDGDHVRLRHTFGTSRLWSGRRVSRADFLAAVAAECDAIVIPREELPERVSPSTDGKWLWADSWNCLATATPDDARRAARAYLALAEYLDAHPPVDEAQVKALAEALFRARPDASQDVDDYRATARILVARGWTKDVARGWTKDAAR